jgi:hypothetical protein
MSHKVPTQSTLKMEDLFTQKISEEQLVKLLRQLFRSKDQIKHILEFIKLLYGYICTHSPNAEITIDQPETSSGASTYFLPGEFEIIINNLGSEIAVDQFPLPGQFETIIFSHKLVCFASGRSKLKYIFRLTPAPRNSISIKPRLPVRDQSPVRAPKSSSSSYSSSSSSPEKKKKSGFFASLF